MALSTINSTDFEFGRIVNGLRQLEAKGAFKLTPAIRCASRSSNDGQVRGAARTEVSLARLLRRRCGCTACLRLPP
jgi:hypothetical protein